MNYFIRYSNGHCGDNICCLSAAIEFAEKMEGIVYADFFQDVIETYNHPRLKFGMSGTEIHLGGVAYHHRNKTPGFFANILGTYYAEFGLPIVDPVLRLPTFEKCESRCLMQMTSNFAKNPPVEYLQGIVDEFTRLTGKVLYVVGNTNTPRALKNVDYSLLKESIPFFMNQVQYAECLLTPRSFGANVAAGYGIPAFMWSPSDGEDWHLDYKTWKGVKCNYEKGLDQTLKFMRGFVASFRLGEKR